MSVAETIETASSFVLDAPPGELQDVIADIKALVNDDPAVLEGVIPAIEKYNKEQLVTTKLPSSGEQVIISEYNCLSDGRFFDVGSQASFEFDHIKQKASNPQSWVFESGNAELIKALLRDVAPHVKEHYPSSPGFGVYPVQEDAAVAVVVVGNKYSPSNYWNGRWRCTYTYYPSSSELTGTIQVDVHYYEDGNVRLLTTKPIRVSLNSGTSAEIIKTIATHERKYQEELNRAFGALSEGAFKNLRRQLPISRQKIDWEKIGNYRLGQEIGGGRSVTR
ncbi:F-actin-capping protein subunit alpha [Tuber indicum]|nr:F-actin-capping protein subunit alpha [Tuber indicum]